MLKLIINNETGFVDHELIMTLKASPKAPHAKDTDWYAKVQSSMEARFGEHLPVHFRNRMSKEQNYPYMHGCTHLVKGHSKSRLYNRPFPVPCKVKSGVNQLLLTSQHGDPCMWMDLKYKCTYNHIVARRGKLLTIQTRSDLIANDDYIAVLDKNHHRVEIVLGPENESQFRLDEPGAPSNSRRLVAYNKLKSLGFMVYLYDKDFNSLEQKRGA